MQVDPYNGRKMVFVAAVSHYDNNNLLLQVLI